MNSWHAAELLQTLGRDGWTVVRTRGDHKYLRHPTKPGLLCVPHQSNINAKTVARILKNAGLKQK